jgi:hypothetical protein
MDEKFFTPNSRLMIENVKSPKVATRGIINENITSKYQYCSFKNGSMGVPSISIMTAKLKDVNADMMTPPQNPSQVLFLDTRTFILNLPKKQVAVKMTAKMTITNFDMALASSISAYAFSIVAVHNDTVMSGISAVSAIIFCLTALIKFVDLLMDKVEKWKSQKEKD